MRASIPVVALLSLLCLGTVLPRPAAAAEGRITSVVILPFATTDEELAIYGKPVADAVAQGLLGAPGSEARGLLRTQAVSLAGTPPPSDLVVELRITREKRRLLRLEASIRDPELGDTIGAVATSRVKLGALDEATAELVSRLSPRLKAAAETRRRRKDEEKAPASVTATKPGPPATPSVETAVSKPVPVTSAPTGTLAPPTSTTTVLLYEPEGEVANGAVEVQGLARSSLRQLVVRLGFQPLPSTNRGIVPRVVAARDARDHGALATVMLRLVDLSFEWHGVLSARGTVRVIVVDVTGKVRLDRQIHTDTVVGSRGDRHDALVRFVLRQAFDTLAPALARALRS